MAPQKESEVSVSPQESGVSAVNAHPLALPRDPGAIASYLDGASREREFLKEHGWDLDACHNGMFGKCSPEDHNIKQLLAVQRSTRFRRVYENIEAGEIQSSTVAS